MSLENTNNAAYIYQNHPKSEVTSASRTLLPLLYIFHERAARSSKTAELI